MLPSLSWSWQMSASSLPVLECVWVSTGVGVSQDLCGEGCLRPHAPRAPASSLGNSLSRKFARAPEHSRTRSPRASCSPGIQLQLSMVHEKWMAAKLGELQAGHGPHARSAHHHHHTEHVCAQGSTSILAVLALHSLAEVSVVVRKPTCVEA